MLQARFLPDRAGRGLEQGDRRDPEITPFHSFGFRLFHVIHDFHMRCFVDSWRRRVGQLVATLAGSAALVGFSLGAASMSDDPPTTPHTPRFDVNKARETFDEIWRVIRDTHYDPNMNGVDWDKANRELRPRIEEARTNDEFSKIVAELIDRLGESHFGLIPAEVANSLDRVEQNASANGNGVIGLEIRLTDDRNEALVTRVETDGPAARAGIRPGWLIAAIDGKPIAKLLEAVQTRKESSDELKKIVAQRLITGKLRGGVGRIVTLTCLDGDDRPVEVQVERVAPKGVVARLGNLPPTVVRLETEDLRTESGKRVGLIRFNIWLIPVASQFDAAIDRFRDYDGIIIDLRGNPGGIGGMAMGLGGHFLSEPVLLGVMTMRSGKINFRVNPRRVNANGERVEPFQGKLAILTDPSSLSTSEIFAGGMQQVGRAQIFGEPTQGMALPSLMRKLASGDVLQHAIADYTLPDGRRLEGQGVIPDHLVPLDRSALLDGIDPPLQAALKWIDADTANSPNSAAFPNPPIPSNR